MNFETFLRDEHAKQYVGLDDDMQHDYEMWVADLDSDEMIEFANKFCKYWVVEELGDIWLCHNCRKENSGILNKYNLF